jgi:hypothetical protein
MWELAHRTREAAEAVRVILEADSSAAAIEQLRSQIPGDHLGLYVRETDRPGLVAGAVVGIA